MAPEASQLPFNLGAGHACYPHLPLSTLMLRLPQDLLVMAICSPFILRVIVAVAVI